MALIIKQNGHFGELFKTLVLKSVMQMIACYRLFSPLLGFLGYGLENPGW